MSWTTITIKDGAGASKTVRAWDESGAGIGPFSIATILADGTGAAQLALADDAAFTPATSYVLPVGFFADESSTDSVNEGDIAAARTTLDRKLIVVPQPHAAGGCSIFRSIDLDESEEQVKGSPGCVYGVWVSNLAATTIFLKFYNDTAANVTVGSTTPLITLAIPGNSSDDVSGNFGPGGVGIFFDTAITVAATTGFADADSGAPGANELLVNIFYK